MRYTKTAIVYRIMELMKIIIKIFRSLSIETKIQTRDPITLKEIQNCVDFAPDGLFQYMHSPVGLNCKFSIEV